VNETHTKNDAWSTAAPQISHAYLDARVLQALAENLEPPAGNATGLRVFDAGCGNGALLARLREKGYSVAGCELSGSGVDIARRALGQDVRIECMSIYDDLAESFGDEWDAVVSTEVIEHLFDPRLFARRVRELLRPGGLLVLSTPYHGYFKNMALAVTGTWDDHLTALWDGGHIKFWSYATIKQLLREFGFEDFRFYGAGRVPWLWKSMVIACHRP
jgi:2-polyprenyl-3-methyl-5-hydroxy-6-metoxy-1,4-benzoquinol methylase